MFEIDVHFRLTIVKFKIILVNEDKLKADLQFLAEKFASSDITRQACEEECHKYMDDDKELNIAFGCPLACAG